MLVEWAITGLDGAIPTHWWWAGPGAATVALVYLLALALVWWRERVEPIAVFTTRRWRWAAMASLAAVGFAFAWPATTPAPALRCTFLSVGHGGATLIELPDGRALLYDAGHMGLPESAAASVSACLWSRGIRRLEAVVVSHADIDHFNAVPELLRRFDIGRVIVPPSVLANTSLAVRELFRSAAAAKVNVATALAGDELPIAGGARGENYSLRVLHPAGDQKLSSDNAESLVLSIEHAGRRALLTGDIDGDGLATLLKTPAIDCDVVAAPHHGSRHSNPLRFARWTTPEWVVVCDGPSAELGPLEAAYGALGGEVLHTARDGAITFDITADAIAVSLFRAPHERHEWATRLW